MKMIIVSVLALVVVQSTLANHLPMKNGDYFEGSGMLQIRKKTPGGQPVDWKPIENFTLKVSKIGDRWMANGSAGVNTLTFDYNVATKKLTIRLRETPTVSHFFDTVTDGNFEVLNDDKTLYIKWVSTNTASSTHHNIMKGSYLMLTL